MLECETAMNAAKKAGQIIKQRKLGKIVEKKSASNLVTDVDKASSHAVIEMLKESFPTYAIISEEEPFREVPKGYVWVIDPLDGTLPYTLGFNYSAVSIALLKDHVPVLGVIYHPFLDEMYVAMSDGSAFLNGKKIQVNETRDLAHASALIDYFHDERENAVALHSALAAKVRYLFSYGCSCYGLTRLSRGTLDLYVHHKVCIWDIAAAAVIVQQAGGKVTDIKGEPLVFNREHYSCIFSNGKIHQEAINTLVGSRKLGPMESIWDWIWRMNPIKLRP